MSYETMICTSTNTYKSSKIQRTSLSDHVCLLWFFKKKEREMYVMAQISLNILKTIF